MENKEQDLTFEIESIKYRLKTTLMTGCLLMRGKSLTYFFPCVGIFHTLADLLVTNHAVSC